MIVSHASLRHFECEANCIAIQAHQLLMNFEEPLKDYVRAVQSVKVRFVSDLNDASSIAYTFERYDVLLTI